MRNNKRRFIGYNANMNAKIVADMFDLDYEDDKQNLDQVCNFTGKIAHPTRGNALRALKSHRYACDMRKKDREPMPVYECQHCHKWHVGNAVRLDHEFRKIDREFNHNKYEPPEVDIDPELN